MNEDTIADLKQFIATIVWQQVSDVRKDISSIPTDIKELDSKLSTKIDDLSQSVSEAIESSNESNDTQLKDYE